MPLSRRPNTAKELKASKDPKNRSIDKSKIVKSFIKIAKPEMDMKGFHHTKETFDK
jgi:hypothetical protein